MKKDVYLILSIVSLVMMSGDSTNFLGWILWEVFWGVVGIVSTKKWIKE